MKKTTRSRTGESAPARPIRAGLRFVVATAAVAVAVLTAHAWAQRADQRLGLPANDRNANFDVRLDRDAAAAAYMARFAVLSSSAAAGLAAPRAAGLARLLANSPGIDVINSPELGTPEVLSVKPGSGFLTGPTTDRVGAMRAFLSDYADVYGVSQDQVRSLDLVANYVNPAGNMAWVEFEQRINGLPVFRGLIRGGFTASGQLARTTGSLAAGLDATLLPQSPILTAAQAVSRASANVGWSVAEDALVQKAESGGRITFARGPMADDARAWLVYFPLAPGVARLAWATEIWGDPDAFLILTDTEDGTVLFRKNLTTYQTQSATYVVYNNDSPAPLSPTNILPGTGTQAPFSARTALTLIGNEVPNTFNTLGWMTDGTNVTDGNNVQAGSDRDGIDGVDAPVTGAGRAFNFAYNPQTDDPLTVPYQNGEATDMFYWTNWYHDRLYLLGFTEAARNFQNDNFGRGGVAGDRVSAESQDSSGTNNANFATPSDGGRGRMQMYIFTGATPDRTSALEHDVLLHELTHGTSNRLHNNAAGLTTTMARGMGEGWSDFYARALLSSAAEDPNGIYASGGWITSQLGGSAFSDNYYYGIRRFPYAVMSTGGANARPHNPLTFADIDSAQINTTDGAYPRNPISGSLAFQVHNIGEVWCMALLEVRARFITRLGWSIGNQRILQYVTDGMKLDPVNPTLLQGRDSIIAAVNAGSGTPAEKVADIADVWAGFAIRGMGTSAQVVNATTGTVVQAFDVPGLVAATGTLVTESIPNGALDPGEVVSVSLCIANNAASTSGSVTGTLLATGGVQSPSGAQSYGTVAPGGNICRNYTLTVNAACGATLTATLQAQESGAATRNLTYSFQFGGSLVPFFSQNFDGVTAPALPAGWTTTTLTGTANLWVTSTTSPDSPPNRAFAANLPTVSDSVLVSPSIAMPAGLAQLTFRHLYNVESGFDGGVLEIKIGAGAFQDILTAGGSFVSGGYNGTLSGLNPLTGRQAWTGNSGSYVTTAVNMPAAAAGQNVQLRWRMTSDSNTSLTGWSVDTVVLSAAQCGISSSPTLTSITPTFGPPAGGTAVSIAGTNFAAGATVTVGGAAATGVTVVNATTITATTGAHASGTVNVVVTNPNTLSGTLVDGFTYLGQPTVTFVSPASGGISGGTSVTISGSLFIPGATVAIGGVSASGVTVANPTTITATTGAHAVGLANVVVTNPDTQTGSLANGFTYLPPPTVTSVATAFGPTAGGTRVTITGTDFITGATVALGGVAATNITVANATTITATTGAHAEGSVNVVVTNPGTQIGTLTNGFTYLAPPTVTSIAPISGPALGGTSVTVTGTGFIAGATVAIGEMAATNITVVGPTTITATTGVHAPGLATVAVTNLDAQTGSLTTGFTYVPPPTVTSITPSSGPIAGGTSVTVTGSGFITGATVTLGGIGATTVTVVNPTTITATTGAHAAGVVDVVVTNSDTQTGTLASGFAYLGPVPTVTAITPVSGSTIGGVAVTITGTNFVTGATVALGGVAATAVTVVNPTTITATTGAHAGGTVNVVVTLPDTQSATLTNGFTYLAVPTVASVVPPSGSTKGGTTVLLTGTNFVAGTVVSMGGVPMTNLTVINATTITATTGAHVAGLVNIVVTNPDTLTSTLSNGFAYAAVSGYTFTTLAGSSGGFGSADGTGTAARFYNPLKVALDAAGNLYVADTNNHVIRKITSAGVVTTLAGSAGSAGSADGTGGAARFNAPSGVAVDSAGTIVYVSDTLNHTIRKITAVGVVTTLAGAAGTSGTTNATGTAARFNSPQGVTVDSTGNVFVADTANHAVRKVTAAGVVTTPAGLAGISGSANGTGAAARFNTPQAVAVDSTFNVYVADTGNHLIRKVTSAGIVTTLAGLAASAGSVDSPAQFNSPQSVAVDSVGNVYVADTLNHTIRKVTSAGVVSTLAGLAGSAGRAEGTGSGARFSAPGGVAVDTAGNLYLADTANHAIRKMTPAAVVSTLAGSASNGSTDTTSASPLFYAPSSVAVDGSGNVYVADTLNHTIRQITPGGIVTTVAGSPGVSGSVNGTGSTARFSFPSGVAVDGSGAVYVADTLNHTIRKITSGVVTTLAGLAGTSGSANGTGAAARFHYPNAVAVDGSGTVYVADTDNHTIRKVTPAGVVTTLAGSAGSFGSVDGTGAAARFVYPAGVAVSSSGTVYVADTLNHTIRTITPAGVVAPLAGSAGNSGSADGTGTAARFTYPFGVGVDTAGNVFVADAGNHTIRLITPAGVVSTIGGTAGTSGNADGTGAEARFFLPTGAAVDGSGNVYVADALNNSVRKGSLLPGAAIAEIPPQQLAISAVAGGPADPTAATASGAPAFGQLDSPLQNATGVTGAIAVSGWALDDLGVTSVKVYRNCVPFETQAHCQTLGGASVVYLGDAAFAVGARPDIEAAFPTYPAANGAGWAYVLPTSTLPHMPNEATVGGQGPFALFAYATDLEGHVTLLGRTATDHTPTALTLDNDHAAAPFGWVDTPAANATVSGTVTVSGRALTPDDGRGSAVPAAGAAMTLFIDGAAVTVPVEYTQLSRGVKAVARLDTTTLSDGMHTAAWRITDSAGRTASSGTRSFLVLNRDSTTANELTHAPAEVRDQASLLDRYVMAAGLVWGRSGFDPASPLDVVASNTDGVLQMRIPVMGRIELQVGSADAGYLVANGTLRDLPPGSQLDPATGIFTWAPGPAYVGRYRLEFLQGATHVPIDVTIQPSPGVAGGIRVGLDGPGEIVSSGPVTISGWAVDPESSTGSGIDAVHVYAYRRNSIAAPIFLGAAELNLSRLDVAQALGASFAQAGFSLDAALTPGDYDLRVAVFARRTGQSDVVRSVRLTIR